MTESWSTCSTAAMSDDDTTTQEEYTSVARADARARTRGMKVIAFPSVLKPRRHRQYLGSTCCGSGNSVCGAYVGGAKATAALSGLVASFAFFAFSALL